MGFHRKHKRERIQENSLSFSFTRKQTSLLYKDSDGYLPRNCGHAAHAASTSHLCGTHSWRAFSVSLPTLTTVAVTAAVAAVGAFAASLSLCVLFILLMLLFCFIVLCVYNRHKIR